MELPTLASLLSCAPTVETQLCLVVIYAVLWWCFINWASQSVVAPYVRSQPWRHQWLQLNKAFFKNSLFTSFDSDADAFAFACLFQAILAQHLMGGLLCLPATLGLAESYQGICASLACHGALCEAGWELQDIVSRAHQRLFQGAKGRAMNPLPLLAVLVLHHAMGQAMVIPMNIFYSDSQDYHEFVFLLQVAAFAAMTLQSYGYTLDVKTKEGLLKMKVTIVVSWCMILYSRILRFAILGFRLMHNFHADGNFAMLYVGGLVLALMGIFNLSIFLDATAKLKKFATMALAETLVEAKSSRANWAKVSGAVLLGSVYRLVQKPQPVTLMELSSARDGSEFCRRRAFQ